MHVNCLALDFDNTLIARHTASKWKGTRDEEDVAGVEMLLI